MRKIWSQTISGAARSEDDFRVVRRYRYLPMREGRWHQATKEKTTYEIERYLVEQFGDLSIEQVTQFELHARIPIPHGVRPYKHGTMKDAQAILRHKHIKTTAEVYMDHIPDSVRKAIDARTEAIFELRGKKRSRKSSGV